MSFTLKFEKAVEQDVGREVPKVNFTSSFLFQKNNYRDLTLEQKCPKGLN